MSTYPHMVNVAWDTVTAFLCDWQREPYRWSKEIDVQVAITSRLSQALRAMGRDTVVANYRSAIEGFHGNQRWSRVCCEPLVRYRFSDGKDYKCYPDIVMLGDAKNPDRPPEEDRGNFPILWACEIKYQGGRRPTWDQDKLRFLVKQGAIRFGCWVCMDPSRASAGNGVKWQRDIEDGHVWICNAQLPACG
ncbi:MAG: hypothetical protein WCC04_15500 [Terriglobales bacterium]